MRMYFIPCMFFIVNLFYLSGGQQHPCAKGCERHALQPSVPAAVPLQLPQITT